MKTVSLHALSLTFAPFAVAHTATTCTQATARIGGTSPVALEPQEGSFAAEVDFPSPKPSTAEGMPHGSIAAAVVGAISSPLQGTP